MWRVFAGPWGMGVERPHDGGWGLEIAQIREGKHRPRARLTRTSSDSSSNGLNPLNKGDTIAGWTNTSTTVRSVKAAHHPHTHHVRGCQR